MTANFRFIQHDGGNGKYSDVVVNGVAVNDLAHAARKVAATCKAHHCFFNAVRGYFPYGFVTLDGKTYRVDVNRDGSTNTVEM